MTNARKLELIGKSLQIAAQAVAILEELGQFEASNTEAMQACVDVISMLQDIKSNILYD